MSQRSVTCRRIDPYVGLHTAAEIKSDLQSRQDWREITEIIKFGNNTHVFKIIFTDMSMVQKALRWVTYSNPRKRTRVTYERRRLK